MFSVSILPSVENLGVDQAAPDYRPVFTGVFLALGPARRGSARQLPRGRGALEVLCEQLRRPPGESDTCRLAGRFEALALAIRMCEQSREPTDAAG